MLRTQLKVMYSHRYWCNACSLKTTICYRCFSKRLFGEEKILGELQMTFGQIIQWYVHPGDIIWRKARLTAEILLACGI